MAAIPEFQAQWDILVKIAISFLAGALIGLEREKARRTISKEELEYSAPPGVRSFGFISLLGMFTVTIPMYTVRIVPKDIASITSFSLMAVFAILASLVIGMYSYHRLMIQREPGITTLIALALTYVIGVGIGLGLLLESIAASVLITFMLAIKLRIEEAVKVLTYEELLSALEIGIIVFLLGPFLAVDITDPWLHVINLRILYGFFVIILILSYVGYILVKALGPKALTYFAFFGGLVHSEATVISITRLCSRLNRYKDIIVGVIATTSAMTLRNMFLILGLLALTATHGMWTQDITIMVLSFLISISIGALIGKLEKRYAAKVKVAQELTIEKPISYGLALKALLVFIVVLLATTFASNIAGELGVLASSIIGGLVSAEATIFSVNSLQIAGKIGGNVALASSILATISAILNKLIYIRIAGAAKDVFVRLILILAIMTIPLIIGVLILLIV